MEELKPCPFCDLKIVDTLRKVMGEIEMGGIKGVWVECLNCHARSGIYKTEEEAIKAWNQRVKE